MWPLASSVQEVEIVCASMFGSFEAVKLYELFLAPAAPLLCKKVDSQVVAVWRWQCVFVRMFCNPAASAFSQVGLLQVRTDHILERF